MPAIRGFSQPRKKNELMQDMMTKLTQNTKITAAETRRERGNTDSNTISLSNEDVALFAGMCAYNVCDTVPITNTPKIGELSILKKKPVNTQRTDAKHCLPSLLNNLQGITGLR